MLARLMAGRHCQAHDMGSFMMWGIQWLLQLVAMKKYAELLQGG